MCIHLRVCEVLAVVAGTLSFGEDADQVLLNETAGVTRVTAVLEDGGGIGTDLEDGADELECRGEVDGRGGGAH